MLEKPPHLNTATTGGPQLHKAIEQISQIVLDGLRHGHFRATISSRIGKGNRRDLVIEAGKSHKFTIPEEELPCRHGTQVGDSCDGNAEHPNNDTIQRHRCESEAGDQRHGAAKG